MPDRIGAIMRRGLLLIVVPLAWCGTANAAPTASASFTPDLTVPQAKTAIRDFAAKADGSEAQITRCRLAGQTVTCKTIEHGSCQLSQPGQTCGGWSDTMKMPDCGMTLSLPGDCSWSWKLDLKVVRRDDRLYVWAPFWSTHRFSMRA